MNAPNTTDVANAIVPNAIVVEDATVTYIAKLSCKCGYQKYVIKGREINKKCPVCKEWLNVRLFPKMDNYIKGLDSTVHGNDTVDINDGTATLLRGLSVDDAFFKAAETIQALPRNLWFSNKMDREFRASGKNMVTFFTERWEDRNLGMQRMNVGNVVRAAIKRSEDQG